MKPIFVTLFLFISMFCVAQDSTVQGTDVRLLPLDKSPMDMAYFPDEYPVLKIKDKVKVYLMFIHPIINVTNMHVPHKEGVHRSK